MNNFYQSERWRRLRKAILQRDGFKCQLAEAQGKEEPAQVVHHIFPRSDYPEFQWCEWNLISLSRAAHNQMHVRDTDELTDRGRLLMLQTAEEQRIGTEKRTVLVIGLPGTGKTTYVKQRLSRGVCYDLDAIAGALRLKPPKEDDYKPARWIANRLLKGFAQAAHEYVNDVFIIRSAPTIEELIEIEPTQLVIIRGGYGNESLTDDRRGKLARRIQEAEAWAKANGVQTIEA